MTDSSKPQSESESSTPEGEVQASHEPEAPRKATLRPPDWTAPNSVSSLALERLVQTEATPRRAGSRAELGSLRARLAQARRTNDSESEKNLSMQLARKLVARGTRLMEATKLARRSLLLGDDPELREELSNWFAGLGEVALAAGTLEPLHERMVDDAGRATIWTRIAVLRGRAGDAVSAAKALWNAAEADRADPVPLELFAGLRLHTQGVLSHGKAARALLEAAKRRRAKNDSRGAQSDLMQAYEADPAFLPSTEQLADSLFQTGRFQAADEVWRLAASRHSDPKAIHARRLRDALGASDVALALGAAIDGLADTSLDLDGIRTAVTLVNDGAGSVPVPSFDGVLGPAGLLPWLAARLEVAALQRGDHKALLALARLTAGPLGNPKQAAQHLVEALVQAPDSEDALRALKEYAVSTGDHAAMVDAGIRIALSDDVDPKVLAAQLAEVARTASQYLHEPDCAAWALGRLSQLGPLSAELSDLLHRVTRRESNTPRFENWSQLSIAELRRALDALADRPPVVETYIEALGEMRRRDPSGARWRTALERSYWRIRSFDRLEEHWREELNAHGDRTAARLGLCRLFLAEHRPGDALQLLRDASAEPLGVEEASLLGVVASLYGTTADRALGLQKIADHARAPVRAVLLSVASQVLLLEGQRDRALRVAEDACHSAPSSARPIVAYAQASLGNSSRVAALSFQRASEVVIPRVEWCRALADTTSDAEQMETALRRWLTLRPLDLEASQRLLNLLVERGDADQLAKTLDWLLGQPVSLADLHDELAVAMRVVLGRNPMAAKALAQRMLGVFGAKEEKLNELIAEIAETLGEPWLRVALLERGLATLRGKPKEEYLQLAAARLELGQVDLVYDALRAALDAGIAKDEVEAWLQKAGEPTTSDGTLAQLECWARVREESNPADSADAYRDLGAARWDLAGDRALAVAAWERASELDEQRGDERLARDLIAFCGYDSALPELFNLAEVRPKERAAGLLIAAAALALADNFVAEAARLALRGLDLDPRRTDGLAIVERSLSPERSDELQRAYQHVNDHLLGVYGERALHYRAARQFERRRQHDIAFPHAVRAFEAVPTEGVAFALMLRLAPLVGQQAEAARSIERVAQAATDPARRAAWLEQAARAAGPGTEGTRLRVEVLMRALLVRPEAESLDSLGSALLELFQDSPDERPKLQAKFDSAVRTLLRRLDQPESVDVAITAARVSAEVFESAGLTAGALRRALQLDPKSPAFRNVLGLTRVLGTKPGSTRPFLDELSEACHREPLPCREVLELGIALAERNANDLLPQFVVAVARVAPDDPKAIARAEALCYEYPHLLEELKGIVDLTDRVSGMIDRAQQVAETDPDLATQMLQDLLKQPDLARDAFERTLNELAELHTRRHREEALEKLLTQIIERERLDLDLRVDAARRLAALLAARDAHTAALDVYALIDRLGKLTEADLEQAAQLARDGGNAPREQELRTRLLAERTREEQKLAEMRRLQELAAELGQTQRALEIARAILAIDSTSVDALDALLKDAERREDWQTYVELGQDRLRQMHEPAEKDILALADVIRFKQKRPRAAGELLAQFAQPFQNSVVILERLSECWVEAEEHSQAAEAYGRASRAARDGREVSRLTELAARHHLVAGELDRARDLLSAEGLYPRTPALVQLRADVAKRQGDNKAHALALEELASASMAPPSERAEYLRTAAELALEDEDPALALKRAQRAARIAPTDPKVQVFARLLEYKQRGAGSAQDALTTITELRSLGRVEDPRIAELRAFLLAEALERRVGAKAAAKELQDAEQFLPNSPLIALGLAQHLRGVGSREDVLGYYKRALGEAISVVRSPVEVALEAAAFAEEQGVSGTAIEMLEPFSGRSPEVAECLTRLRNQPSARTRFDLPQMAPQVAKAPEFFASVPPSVASVPGKLTRSAPVGPDRKPTPKPKSPPATPPAPSPAQQAPTPALGTPRQRPPEANTTPPKPLRLNKMATAQPHASVLLTPTVGIAPPTGNDVPVPAAPVVKDPPSLHPTAIPLEPQPIHPRLTHPPKKPATQTSGEYRAVRPRLDQTIEVPSFQIPKEKPVDVTVKADQRTLGRTWTSSNGEDVQAAIAKAHAEKLAHREQLNAAHLVLADSVPSMPADSMVPSVSRGPTELAPSVARTSLSFPASNNQEETLRQALLSGNVEAGKELYRRLKEQPSRSHDLVSVARTIVQLTPGQIETVEWLIDAAERDRDLTFAGALRHSVWTFKNPGQAPPAPPLQHQSEQPEVLARLLCGTPLPPSLEALGLLSRSVPQLFRHHEPIDDTEPVAVDALSPQSQLIAALHRLMGTHKTQVLERPGKRGATFRLLLTEPHTLLIEGQGNPLTSEYRHYCGATLFSSRPELALANGLPAERLSVVFDAILAAFGPPKQLQGDVARVAQLAERLWESLPARAQRRLQELCERPELMSAQKALVAAQGAWLRAGLFASGDVAVAARDACLIVGVDPQALYHPGSLGELCRQHELLADLFRFATSLEFAALRWTQPRTLSSVHDPLQ